MPQPVFKDYSDTESHPGIAPEGEEEGEDKTSDITKTVSTPGTTSFSFIRWCGATKKIPILNFSAQVLLLGLPPELKPQAEKFHLSYKFVKTECKLVRSILNSHAFREVHPNSSNFNLMWTGSHLKPHSLRGMQDFQKINHFPRSYELTRKDRLYKNIQRLQHSKGLKHFDFIPNSFVLPEEYNEFYAAFMKERGHWIVKPVASSRGRGIFLISHPSQVPLDDHLLVCRYITNPLLIDGFKFDVRLYIGVTCYDPLRIYLYEEGLSRFATVKYDKSGKNIRNSCMHLTNYSVNKKSENFVSCQDPEVEDYGNKWSMSAMLRFLKHKGIDTTALMMRIEDVVVKTIIAGELPIASACKMFMPHPGNCFEIYGFDILIDENLRPWLLEVNLSPSLACDSPLDLKIKSHLVTDMFNLIGFVAHDPLIRRPNGTRRVPDYAAARNKKYQKQRTQSAGALSTSGLRPTSAAARRKAVDEELTLTPEESRILRQTKEEYARRGGFVRIFPSSESWELYGSFLEHRTTHNHLLHSKLFPGRKSSLQARPSTASLSSATARAKSLTMYKSNSSLNSTSAVELPQPTLVGPDELSISLRISCYERKLDSWSTAVMHTKRVQETRPPSSVDTPSQSSTRPSINSDLSRTRPEGEADKPRVQDTPPLPKDEKPPVSAIAQPEIKPAIAVPTAHSATRPPRPQASQETVSKRALSAQPRFKAVRVDDIMEKCGTLTKLQARQAFAMYLQRVQQRLIQEASYDSDDSTGSPRQDEQMSLVIRFLKKAAGNLQQPFKVVIPSRKLALHDRRRILAKQLGDFVHVYGKETAQIQRRHDINRAYGLLRTAEPSGEIPDEEFKIFMAIASETELEDLLTRYTKLNKNASVFLGGRPERASDSEDKERTVLQRRKEAQTNHIRASSTTGFEKPGSKPLDDLSSTSPGAMVERHARALTAVSAYGASVALNKGKQRPASARPSFQAFTDNKPVRATRPFSAKISRDHPSPDGSGDSMSREKVLSRIHQRARVASAPEHRDQRYQMANEHAVADVLERLARRQSARNYSALNTTGSPSNWDQLFRKLDFNPDTSSQKPGEDGYITLMSHKPESRGTKRELRDSHLLSIDKHSDPIERLRDTHAKETRHFENDSMSHARNSRDRHVNADETFKSFVDFSSGLPNGEQVSRSFSSETAVHKHTGAGGRSIKVEIPSAELGTRPVKQTADVIREQKGPISREDYNKHIRLLSQKLMEEKIKSQPCLPHPPVGPSPARKTISAKRMASLTASPHFAYDVVTGSSDADSYSLDDYT